MSAPQPPADHDPTAPGEFGRENAPTPGADATYDFHGEKMDFDPYRFGAPEPVAPAWTPPAAPTGDPGRPPTPGERWSPGGGEPGAEVRPGDYWQGGGSAPRQDAVFPPAGYAPLPPGSEHRGGGVDLGKSTAPGSAPSGYPPPSATGYPQPGYPPAGYAAPGGYPGRNGPSEADRWRAGNKIAVWGFGVSLLGCALFFTSFFAVIIGGTGLGLSIAGLVKARRGAPHKTFAVLGIVFSILAIVAGVAILVYALSQYDLSCIANLDGDTSRISECTK